MDSDLPAEYRYPTFEKLRSELHLFLGTGAHYKTPCEAHTNQHEFHYAIGHEITAWISIQAGHTLGKKNYD